MYLNMNFFTMSVAYRPLLKPCVLLLDSLVLTQRVAMNPENVNIRRREKPPTRRYHIVSIHICIIFSHFCTIFGLEGCMGLRGSM